MFWLLIICIASSIGALLALDRSWRRKFEDAQLATRTELASLHAAQDQAGLQVRAQQEVIFNSMVEGLLLLNDTGRIQLANRAFGDLFGATADLRSRTIIEALRLHELAELVDSLSAEKQVLDYEFKLSRPNERWLEVNGAAFFDSRGRRSGTILVFHDLTRLKQLESARQEFVANVSHELRTPLSLIKGYVETLLDGAKDDPKVAGKFLLTIERNADRLKLLIEDLLSISELESGRVKLNLQAVALATVVEKVLSDFKKRADARGTELLNQAPALMVRADPDRLEQVLCNLVDNAIKYGRTEGCVTVGGRSLGNGQCELYVQDDGPGIPPESLERVFERFYRVDKARSREQGGTGLGLSIVKHIVQTHGGKVWAKSEPDKGATFSLTLPLDSGESQQPLPLEVAQTGES